MKNRKSSAEFVNGKYLSEALRCRSPYAIGGLTHARKQGSQRQLSGKGGHRGRGSHSHRHDVVRKPVAQRAQHGVVIRLLKSTVQVCCRHSLFLNMTA
jgi:hypothetical protein